MKDGEHGQFFVKQDRPDYNILVFCRIPAPQECGVIGGQSCWSAAAALHTFLSPQSNRQSTTQYIISST